MDANLMWTVVGSAAAIAAVGVGLWQGSLQFLEHRRRQEPKRQAAASHLPPDIREFSDRAAELDQLELLVGQGDGATLMRMNEEVWVLRSIGTLKEYLGLVYQNLGDLERAGANHIGSIDAFRRLGLRHGLARTLRNLGRLRMRQESWGQAAEVLEESFQTFKATGFRYEEARTLELLGDTLSRAEGSSAARARWAEALQIYASLECLGEAENVRGRIDALAEALQ